MIGLSAHVILEEESQMSLAQNLLPEFDQEMANTRKLLECIPEKINAGWKPHDKSMTLGRLAGHVAELPGWAMNTIRVDSLNFSMGDFKPFSADAEGSPRDVRQECSGGAAIACGSER